MLEVGAFHPAWGDIHLGPENALEGARAARRRRLPAHPLGHVQPRHARVGQPAETLLELAPKARRALVMPRLGEAVEPAHVDRVAPWWRGVDAMPEEAGGEKYAPISLPKAMPWPLD